MSTAADATVILLQQDPIQEKLIAIALQSMNLRVRKISPADAIDFQLKLLTSGNARNRPVVICADLVRLAKEQIIWSEFCDQIKNQLPQAKLIATNSQMLLPHRKAGEWVKQSGGLNLFGRFSARRYLASIQLFLAQVASALAIEANAEQLQSYANSLLTSEDASNDPWDLSQQAWALLDELNTSPEQLMTQMANQPQQVPVSNRRYRLRLYRSCFLGSEATSWMVGYLKISTEQAVAVGDLLLKCRLIDHVTREHAFQNSDLFYRFRATSKVTDRQDFSLIARELPHAFEIQDRSWRGKAFPRCFKGDQAVNALMNRFGLTELESLWLGQQLQDLYLFRHVAEAHQFQNHGYFYRLTQDAPVSA